MISSDMSIEIDSMRCNKTYEVTRFSEFDISLDLEVDADSYDIVAENPNGIYTGLFCRFDKCRIKVNKKTVLVGTVDCITYYISGNKDYVRISGRDLCWKLVDNDASPDTLENVQPKKYIEQKCKKYGIKHNISNADVYGKLVIGCGESEISIINNLLLDGKQRVWYSVDTLYTGIWNTSAKTSHTFVMGSSDGIPIISVEYKEDGTDMLSKVLVYGSDGEGNQKIMGEYSNPFMTNRGINKVSIKRYYSDSAASKYTSVAERTVRDEFRDDTELTISVPIMGAYMPNTTARVIIDKLGIDATFFIKSVQYTKGISDGSNAILKLIPSDSAFEKLWNSSTAITLTNFTRLSKQLANYSSNVPTSSEDSKSDAKYFPACTNYHGVSIVDGLRSVGASNSYAYRTRIAKANGISNYTGSGTQNTQLLNKLKSGVLIRP